MLEEFEKNAWRYCLIFWEAMATIPSFDTHEGNGSWTGIEEFPVFMSIKFKRSVLERLGFDPDFQNGCPLCETYMISDDFNSFDCDCTGCPIGRVFELDYGCLKTSYRTWEHKFDHYNDHIHDQNAAEEFYKFLIALAKYVGYEPDFQLKFWDEINEWRSGNIQILAEITNEEEIN